MKRGLTTDCLKGFILRSQTAISNNDVNYMVSKITIALTRSINFGWIV